VIRESTALISACPIARAVISVLIPSKLPKVIVPSAFSILVVACDQRDLESNNDFILYPKLIIEVLSNSTQALDRGDKFADYKAIATFEEYVLIHQKQILVERFQRRGDNLWTPRIYPRGDAIEFDSIHSLASLYENATRFLV
jgi:hypothetical protein